jgi:hypothetical protein
MPRAPPSTGLGPGPPRQGGRTIASEVNRLPAKVIGLVRVIVAGSPGS